MRKWLVRASMFVEMNRILSTLTLHNPDFLTGEEGKLRLLMLKVYARFEVQLLKMFWFIFQSPLMKSAATRKFLYYTLAKFMAEHAVAGQFMTLEEVIDFMDDLPGESTMAVGPCRCRLAIGHRVGCEHPLETDIVIATGTPVWLALFPEDYRIISREEATRIIKDGYEKGLLPGIYRHMYFKGSRNYFVICNCCKEACLPIIGYRAFKAEGMRFIPSLSVAEVDLELCEGCGTCVEICAFEERALEDGKSRTLNCQGCGQCAFQCPHNAITMVKRPTGVSPGHGTQLP